ncbi:23S rRNA (uracil(1939)-C(5))-methyltransferase RlmD [Ruoffia tabacinasalis]|uniref:23S rRNA (Uracil(1939)-C(5))-methyltransferase RlmD n=1 Tax=Ruoffia tabacinasalis TaxID=87458 RepID=A0ABS0LH24_9LACT|nr:23S rRNA (uracil(1939)-C(5))-methyltransferase RlmD [Ruoffia tabacinasalis]MBG9977571.1 23S rRNA (uracil(1939)-C(5))-methyltransferase RlmD [Ruoffia tabacinasalis]
MANKVPFKKNDTFTGTVEDITSQGQGVVKIDHYPFFIEGAMTGEVVKFKAMKVGKTYGFGCLLEIIEESPERVEMTDLIGRQIGTMTLQHMSYDAQLAYKEQQVKSAYERIGHFEDAQIRPVLGMENPWEYRNKAQIPVREINGQLETGFFRRNSHDLVPVENFFIQHKEIDEAILIVRDILRRFHVPAYIEKNHTGIIRHVVVRRGHYSGQVMVTLVTNKRKMPNEEIIVDAIAEEVPNIASIVQNVQTKRTNVILGRQSLVLWGQPYIEDSMLDLTFRISSKSFYQVNTPQAEVLYKTAIDAADLQGNETVLDAYSGIGTIGLSLAQHAKQVYGMDIVDEAVEMAKQNAKLNGIKNAAFEVGSAEEWLPKWNEAGINFDVIVVDPPRKGLDQVFVDAVIEQQPEKIVYVSCNPATQARDARLFADAGYDLQFVQPVDLFGQTTHVEAVALFTKA